MSMAKRFLLILIISVIVALLAALFAQKGIKPPIMVVPTPSPYALDTLTRWKDVVPGASSLEDVKKSLGSALSSENTTVGTVYYYPSDNQYWKNEVTVANSVVSFVALRIFPPADRSLKKLTETITEKPAQLYGPDTESGFYLFVYPETGVAFLANSSKDVVYQIWRFPPTTLEGFLRLPQAARYGLKPQPEQEGI